MQAGGAVYVPEAANHQGEQQMTPFSGLKKKKMQLHSTLSFGRCL